MAKTSFRGFSARNQGLKHNYTYKPKVYSVKQPVRTPGRENREAQGLKRRKQDLTVMIYKGGRAWLLY
jgi:hypothetical protein